VFTYTVLTALPGPLRWPANPVKGRLTFLHEAEEGAIDWLNFVTTTSHRHTTVSWCRKKSSGLRGAREDNRGRHADHPDEQLSTTASGLISNPRSSSPIFMPDALPATTLPLYPGWGQAPNMLSCIPSGVVSVTTTALTK